MATIVALLAVHHPDCQNLMDHDCSCPGVLLPPVYATFDSPKSGDMREAIIRARTAATLEAQRLIDEGEFTFHREDQDPDG